MSATPQIERTLRLKLLTQYTLDRDLLEFHTDRRARGLAPHTLLWYERSLAPFREFLRTQNIERTEDIAPSTLRAFVLHLQGRGHSPGGVKNVWGAVKAFLNWYKAEYAPGWPNPIDRAKTPKVPEVRLDPIPLPDVKAMLYTCRGKDFTSARDAALLLALLDTGARAGEFLAVNLGDVNLAEGVMMLTETKGKRIRAAFLGQQARRALLRYLRQRDGTNALRVVLGFERAQRRMICNKTQALRLAEIIGSPSFADWPGHSVILCPANAPNGKPTIAVAAAEWAQ